MATVVGMSRHAAIHHVTDRGDRSAGRLRTRIGRQPAVRHQRRRPAAGKGNEDNGAQRPAADCQAEERLVVARLHVAGIRRRRGPRAGRREAGLRKLRRRPRPGQRRRRDAEHRRGARPLSADAGRCRPAGLHHRFGPAVVAATAGVAGARGRRRAAQPPDRRRRPPRHGLVEPGRLPRPVRPPGDPRPGAVRVRQRPGRQPRRHRAERHHQLHRHHRARRLRLRQHPRRHRYRAAAQHLGRAGAGADRHRQRRPGGAVLRQLASRPGRQAGPRLPGGAGCRRRSRSRAEGQRSGGGAGRVRRAVRGGELPAGPRSQRPR